MRFTAIGTGALFALAIAVSAAAAVAQTRPGPAPRLPYAPASGMVQTGLFPQIDPFAASLQPNQTDGFGANRILRFTYQEQFDCVVQPNDDRNYSGVIAAKSAEQFNSPECQIGAPSTIDPTGAPASRTDVLYVLVPFFETNPRTPAFTPALGKALKKLFGMVPDAFKPNPGVYVQCPGAKGMPGTCTMHAPQVDLGPVLAALKKVPPKTEVYVPLPNHDHLLPNNTINQSPEWWVVDVVLVESPKVWPSANGKTGITSVAKLMAAQKAGTASAAVPSNFYLFFSSRAISMPMSSPMSM